MTQTLVLSLRPRKRVGADEIVLVANLSILFRDERLILCSLEDRIRSACFVGAIEALVTVALVQALVAAVVGVALWVIVVAGAHEVLTRVPTHSVGATGSFRTRCRVFFSLYFKVSFKFVIGMFLSGLI